MKGAIPDVDKVANVVLFRLRLGSDFVLSVDLPVCQLRILTMRSGWGLTYFSHCHVVQILEPAIACLCSRKVKHARVDELLDVDLAEA